MKFGLYGVTAVALILATFLVASTAVMPTI